MFEHKFCKSNELELLDEGKIEAEIASMGQFLIVLFSVIEGPVT